MSVLAVSSAYRARFDELRARGDDQAAPAWLRERRRAAMARFDALGFPTTRDEEWRFTSVAPVASRTFEWAPADGARASDEVARHLLRETAARQAVMVDGRMVSVRADLPVRSDGVLVVSLRSLLNEEPGLVEHHLAALAGYEEHAFTALNTALFEDGVAVIVPARAQVQVPIHVLFYAGASGRSTASFPRLLVVAGPHSQVTVVESYAGAGVTEGLTNAVTELAVGEGAVVDHYKVLREPKRAFHVAATAVRLERGSTFSSHSITLGGGLVRNDVVAVLAGEGADCTLNGLYLVDGDRLVDNHTTIDHTMAHCASHELYKGILDGHGRAVFNGKIIVRPDAQKTDAKQTNKALLLSESGQINTKPQLEIFADDVKCTHGATVGQLDEDALFYLQSRGIGRTRARNLLIHAFASDILRRVRVPELQARLEDALTDQLPGGHDTSFS